MKLKHLLNVITICLLPCFFSCLTPHAGGTSETGNARVCGSVLIKDCDTSSIIVHLVNQSFIPGTDTAGLVFRKKIDSQGNYQFESIPHDDYYLYIRGAEQSALEGPFTIEEDSEMGKDTLQYTASVSIVIPDSTNYDFVFIKGTVEEYRVGTSGLTTISSAPSGVIELISASDDFKTIKLIDSPKIANKISISLIQMDTVQVGLANLPPIAKAMTNEPSRVYQLSCSRMFIDTIFAQDPENDTISFELTKAPSGMSIDSLSGVIYWSVPDLFDNKTVSISVLVRDNRGASRSLRWTFTIQDTCTTIPLPRKPAGPDSGLVGQSYFFTIDTSGIPKNSMYKFDWGDSTYSNWQSALPDTHLWPSVGIYSVRAMISTGDTMSHSAWSEIHTILINSSNDTIYPITTLYPDSIGTYDTVLVEVTNCGCSDSSTPLVSIYLGFLDTVTFHGDGRFLYAHFDTPGSYVIDGKLFCDSGTPSYSDKFYIGTVHVTGPPDTQSVNLPPDTLSTNQLFTFRFPDTTCIKPAAAPIYIEWGDGTLGTQNDSMTSHVWRFPGTYTIESQWRCEQQNSSTLYIFTKDIYIKE